MPTASSFSEMQFWNHPLFSQAFANGWFFIAPIFAVLMSILFFEGILNVIVSQFERLLFFIYGGDNIAASNDDDDSNDLNLNGSFIGVSMVGIGAQNIMTPPVYVVGVNDAPMVNPTRRVLLPNQESYVVGVNDAPVVNPTRRVLLPNQESYVVGVNDAPVVANSPQAAGAPSANTVKTFEELGFTWDVARGAYVKDISSQDPLPPAK